MKQKYEMSQIHCDMLAIHNFLNRLAKCFRFFKFTGHKGSEKCVTADSYNIRARL